MCGDVLKLLSKQLDAVLLQLKANGKHSRLMQIRVVEKNGLVELVQLL